MTTEHKFLVSLLAVCSVLVAVFDGLPSSVLLQLCRDVGGYR